jgi:hypothetical protein
LAVLVDFLDFAVEKSPNEGNSNKAIAPLVSQQKNNDLGYQLGNPLATPVHQAYS